MEAAAKGWIFQRDFSETSVKTAPVADLQHDPHMPWSQSHQQQAELDALSNTRPTTWFHPVSPRRRIPELQMGVTQVWQHKSMRHMSNINCIAQCLLRVYTPTCSSSSNPSQIEWLITFLQTSLHKLVSCCLCSIWHDEPSIWSLNSFSWLTSCWFDLFHNLLVSPDFCTQGLGFTSHLLLYFLKLSEAFSLHGHVSVFLVWSLS